MKYAVTFAALLLGACVHQEPQAPVRDLTVVQQECGMATQPFPSAWPCVRTEVANVGGGGGGEGSDIRDLYLATGDYISEQVSMGKMTDAQARLAIAEARTKAKNALDARVAASTPSAPVFVPRRTWSRERNGETAPAVMPPNRPQITCWHNGPVTTCN